jgi:hypothetical protein
MSENGKDEMPPPAPPQATNIAPQMSKIQCMQCKQEINVRMPTPRVVNQIDFSMLVFVHERMDRCPHCQTMYLVQIGGINEQGQLQLKWVKVIPREAEQTILAPTTSNLRSALMTDQIAKGAKKQ